MREEILVTGCTSTYVYTVGNTQGKTRLKPDPQHSKHMFSFHFLFSLALLLPYQSWQLVLFLLLLISLGLSMAARELPLSPSAACILLLLSTSLCPRERYSLQSVHASCLCSYLAKDPLSERGKSTQYYFCNPKTSKLPFFVCKNGGSADNGVGFNFI